MIFIPSPLLLSIAFSDGLGPLSWKCSLKWVFVVSFAVGLGLEIWSTRDQGGRRNYGRVGLNECQYLVAISLLFVGLLGTVFLYGLEHACSWKCALKWDAFYISLPLAMWLAWEKSVRGSLSRIRHAIVILALIGVVIASASAASWEWLNNDADSNSESVQHIALGIAAVLTLIFVIWRERIASGKASFERYTSGVRMLGDETMTIRLAGIGIIVEACQNPIYRDQGRRVLETFVSEANSDSVDADLSPVDVRAAREAMRKMRRRRRPQT